MFLFTKKLLFLSLLVAVAAFSFSAPVFAQDAQEETPPQEEQNQGEGGNQGNQVEFDAVGGFVYSALTTVGALVAKLGGDLLNISLSWFVFGMKSTVDAFQLNNVIEDVWELIRDIFNLLFIFGVITIGFRIILGIGDSQAKRTLGTLVVAALFINFSLYATQVVVDFANIAAAEIGVLFQPEEGTVPNKVLGLEVTDISSSFISATNITELSKNTLQMSNELRTGEIKLPSTNLGLVDALGLGITIAILLILIGFVFAAGAFFMFTRFFYLVFLMIFSPVMFLGFVLPNFKRASSDWWRRLFSQALVGPAFLFMLYVALLAIRAISTRVSNGDMGMMSFVLSSLLMVGFVWSALIVAQKLGTIGANQAISLGKAGAKWGRGATVGFAGRRTFGRLGDAWNRRLEDRGVSDKDPRRKLSSSLAKSKYGGSYSQIESRESSEKAAQKGARYQQLYAKEKASDPETRGVIPSIAAATGAGASADDQVIMERKITGATNEQMVELLSKSKQGTPEYDALVRNMTSGQFDAAMKAKTEELDDSAKNNLKNARTLASRSILQENAVKKAKEKDSNAQLSDKEALQEGIGEASESQLKTLGVGTVVDYAAYLKQSQFDDIMKSKDYTETEKSLIRTARENKLLQRFNNSDDNIFKGLKDKDIASLPKKILLDERSVPNLTGGALKKIADDDKLDQGDRSELVRVINSQKDKKHPTAKNYLDSPQGQERYG